MIDDGVSSASKTRGKGDGKTVTEAPEPEKTARAKADSDVKTEVKTVAKPASDAVRGGDREPPPPLRDLTREADASAKSPAVQEAYRASMRDRFREPPRGNGHDPIHDLVRDLVPPREPPPGSGPSPGAGMAPARAADFPQTITVRNPGMSWFMAVVVILGLIGAGLMAWQLNVLQSQMGDLRSAIAQNEKVADATSRLSDAATQSNEIATQSMTSATRPWVGVEAVEANPIQANQPLTMEVRVRNSGRTPSTDVQGLFLVYISPLDNPPALLTEQCPSCVRSVVLPNGVVSFKLSVRGSVMGADEVQRIRDGKDTMWIVGRLDYHDGEGEAHTTRSCLYYRTGGIPAFTACADGNSAN